MQHHPPPSIRTAAAAAAATRQGRRRSVKRRSRPSASADDHSPTSRVVAVVARSALRLVAGASAATSALLLLQLAWVALRTPRLPPPPSSGVNFPRGGRVVRGFDDGGDDDDDDGDAVVGDEIIDDHKNDGDEDGNKLAASDGGCCVPSSRQKEFRLILVGDSPVEGIGNARHSRALGGRTARAFARLVCSDEGRDRVRYWSYGKSGLTARGIEEEMVPLLHRAAEDAATRCRQSRTDNPSEEGISEPAIHAVILLCGVNNVLDPRSTPASYRSEVRSLLRSMRSHRGLEKTPLMVLGLPDFARLPFLPWWPLGFALGLRGRRMQRELEAAVAELRHEEKGEGDGRFRTAMVKIPELGDVLGAIGYHRHENAGCKGVEAGSQRTIEKGNESSCRPLERTILCHPLLKYLRDDDGPSPLDQRRLGSLGIKDFLCDDGFHPGRYGTVYIGSLLAEAYKNIVSRGAASLGEERGDAAT